MSEQVKNQVKVSPDLVKQTGVVKAFFTPTTGKGVK